MGPRSVDLYGWDTAFALRLQAFDRLLGAKAEAAERSHTLDGKPGGSNATLNWRFTGWRVVEAVGSRIALEVTLDASSRLSIGNAAPLDVSAYVVNVAAEMVLKPRNDGGLAPARQALSASSALAGAPWAAVAVDAGEHSLGFRTEVLLQQVLDDWFRTADAVAAFDARFAGLSIDTLAVQKGLEWLTPRVVGFAGATLPDGDLAIGLLARTAPNSDAIGANWQLSPYAIADKADAGFAISARRFFEHLLVPALPYAFGADPKQAAQLFDVRDSSIVNRTLLTFALTTADGKQHDATIDPGQMEFAIDGDELILRITDMSFCIAVGDAKLVNISVSLTERMKPMLTSIPGQPDKKVLSLQQSADPIVQHSDEETLWALGGELLFDIVVAIASVLLSKFGPKFFAGRGLSPIAAKVATAITVVIAQAIGAVLTRIPDIIAHFEELSLDQMPDFGLLLARAFEPIQWQNSVRYALQDARLADALILDVKLQLPG